MPRFNHIISERHLELFLPENSKDRKLHVYSKKEGYIGRKSYSRIAGDFNIYPDLAEKQMSVIEGRAIKVIRAIARGVKFDLANPKKREEWYSLLLYLALTASRHPQNIDEWRRQTWRSISTHPMLLTHWREMRVEDTLFEGLFQAVIPAVERPLWQLQWEAIRIEKSNDLFAISDRGVDIAWAGSYGPVNDKSLVVMPLSKNVVLVGGKNIEVIRPLFTNLNVGAINSLIYQRAHEYIFSTEKLDYELLERGARVQQYGQDMWEQEHGLPAQPTIEVIGRFRPAWRSPSTSMPE